MAGTPSMNTFPSATLSSDLVTGAAGAVDNVCVGVTEAVDGSVVALGLVVVEGESDVVVAVGPWVGDGL